MDKFRSINITFNQLAIYNAKLKDIVLQLYIIKKKKNCVSEKIIRLRMSKHLLELIVLYYYDQAIRSYTQILYKYQAQDIPQYCDKLHKAAISANISKNKLANAQYEYAVLYDKGININKNYDMAMIWYRYAELNGHKLSKSCMYSLKKKMDAANSLLDIGI